MPGHVSVRPSGDNTSSHGTPTSSSSSSASRYSWILGCLLLLGCCSDAVAHPHKWNVLQKGFRFMQETMLRNSLERAHLNYGIVFECRTM